MAESQLAQQLARIESMTNVELRAELKQRGCPTSGNKKDLLAKLRTALQKEHQDTSAELDQSADVAASTMLSISSVPVIAIPRVDVDVSLASTPEKTTRARSKRGSTSTPNGPAPHPAPVDVRGEDNHREVNAPASTSVDEKDSDVEHVGEKSSLGDTSVRADANVEDVPLPTATEDVTQTVAGQTQNDQPSKAAVEEREVAAPVAVPSSDAKPTVVDEPVIVQKDEPSVVSKATNGITLPAQKLARPPATSFTKGFNRSTANKLNLSSDLLKTLIPDLTLAPASAVNDELEALINDDSINGQPTNVSTLDSDVDNAEPMTIGDLADGKQPKNRTVVVDVPVDHDELAARKRTNPAADRKSNPIIADEPIRIKHAMAAQEPASQILHISGLTRPFSLFQLKELLGRYGELVDGEFWLERIKSQCFVTYTTLDEAQNAREALDGCRWPLTNPKTLSVRFGRAEELQFSKTHDLPPDQMSVDSLDRVMQQQQVDVGSSHRSTNGTKVQTGVHESRPAKSSEQARSGFLIEEEDEPAPVEEPPAKDLDDYFRKTKAKPYIYWLPLTEEQVVERERRAQQRRAKREENASMSDPNSRHKRKRSFSPSRRR